MLSANVGRSWPDTIVITVRERTPQLAVAAIGGGYDLVDEYGVTVAAAARKPAGMPLLTAPPAVLRGSPACPSRRAGAAPAAARAAREGRCRSRPRRRRRVTLHLGGGVTVLWGSPGQAARKAAELELLLRRHARYLRRQRPGTAVTQG